jgi:spore germination protein YaaH
MIVTAKDIAHLNEELSRQENQHFDSLRLLIHAISAHIDDSVAVFPPAPSENKSISEDEFNALVGKIIPILQQKDKEKDEKNDTARQEKLKRIQAFFGRAPGQIDTLRIGDNVGRTYILHLGDSASVTGIHPFWMADKYLNYNFAALSTVSFYGLTADGKTGQIKKMYDPAALKVLAAAQQAKCNTTFTLYNPGNLLDHEPAQLLYIDSLLPVLQQHNVGGINIWFGQISHRDRDAFTRFVTLMVHYFRRDNNRRYQISVTVPSNDNELAYDLRAMDSLVDHFIIDFTQPDKRTAGATAPLKGDPARAIQPVISRYLNLNIAPKKFIALLSYQGTIWKMGRNGTANTFGGTISYNDIKRRFPSDTAVFYDEVAAAAILEEKKENGEVTSEIWFDDATTLDIKYDYIKGKGLGGVAIWPLGADDGYTELWEGLADKFISIDTTFIETVELVHTPAPPLSLWKRIVNRFHIEKKAFLDLARDPCSVKPDSYKSDEYLGWITLFFLLITIAVGLVYAYQVRMQRLSPTWQKRLLWLFIGLLLFTFFCAGAAMFMSKHIPWLGVTDDPSGCKGITLSSVVIVFFSGVGLGMLIMRVFVFPGLRKEERP